MNTTIKTSSEKQFTQIRRFVKKNKIHNTLFGLKPKELEKFIKDFIKTNHLTKVQQQEPLALAA